jgi:hypothetical protein
MTEAELQARIDAANLASGIMKKIMTGSDRAVGIVGGAVVEDGLTKLMKACWYSRQNAASVIGNLFGPAGPLGSFSTKISVAY